MEQVIIDLPAMKPILMELAEKIFNEILSSPGRIDDKERTGIALSMYVPETRNGIAGQIGLPSDMAVILSVLKSAKSRQCGTTSSSNHENPKKMMFSGSFTVNFYGYDVQCGISGLIGFEDAATAAILQACANKQTVNDVLKYVHLGKNETGKPGKIPVEFDQEGHYIRSLLLKYNNAFVG